MSVPNYKLRDDHVATVKHMRDERLRNDTVYATKTQNTDIQESLNFEIEERKEADIILNSAINQLDASRLRIDGQNSMSANLKMNNNKIVDLSNGTNPQDAVTKSQLDLKADQSSTYNKTETDDLLFLKANKLDVYTQFETNNLLDEKRDIGTFDQKIQNSTGNSSVNCTSDRYIELRSNGGKICDILEDETNAGFTLNTYNRRMNLVSNQPQTLYHNSGSGLFNFKYTDDGDVTPGQLRFGQIQLAPSNTTNINPAVTISSSRINGLGTAGAIYLDSNYGQVETPFILCPQSLTDSGANQLQMFRSTASSVIKNIFTGKTGLSTTQSSAESNEFLTKSLADSLYTASGVIQGITQEQADGRYLQLTGGTLSGSLILNADPTQDLEAVTKQYLDNQIAGIDTFLTQDAADQRYFLSNPQTNLNMNGKQINNMAQGPLPGDATNRGYVEGEVAQLQGQIDNLDVAKISQSDADLRYLQLTGGTLNGNLTMSSGRKIIQNEAPLTGSDLTNKTYVDSAIGTQLVPYITTTTADSKYYSNTTTLNNISQPNGQVSMNNFKIANLGNPESLGDATNKNYVDQSISTALSGYQPGNISTISSANGYSLNAGTSRLRLSDTANSRNLLDIQGDSVFLRYIQQSGSVQQFQMLDSSQIDYYWGYNVLQNNNRPIFRITDKGTEATQTFRLSCFRNNAGLPDSETYLQIKPASSLIEVNAPIRRTGAYSAPTNYQELTPKQYVDDQIANVGSTLSIKSIQGTDARMKVECTNTPDVIVTRTDGNGDYLILTENTVRVDNGSTLNLQRGSTQMQIIDTGDQYIQANCRMQYSPPVQFISNQDQLLSRRLTDGLYYSKLTPLNQLTPPSDSLNMNAKSITNMNPAFASGMAVEYSQLLAMLPYAFQIYIGDIPVGSQSIPLTSIKSRNNVITGVNITQVTSFDIFARVFIDTAVFPNQDYIITNSIHSNKTTSSGATVDNDVTFITYNRNIGYFDFYIEDRTSGTQQVYLTGILQRY